MAIMLKALLTGIAALFLATGTAHADGPKQTLVGEWYFNGMMAGFGAANAALELKGQQPLFCPPENLTLTGDILQDLMRTFGNQHPEIRKHASGTGMVVGAPFGAAGHIPMQTAMSTRALIIGIAALFLATGAAN